MIRSSWCDYCDAYILVKGTITVPNTVAVGAVVNNTNKKAIFKNCAPFTSRITEINNTEVHYAEDIDIVIHMHNLIEHSDAYLKTSGSLWQNYRDEPSMDTNSNITDFTADNTSNGNSFKFKQQITGQTGNGGTKNVEIMVPLKYLSNVLKTLEIPLINCKITLQLACSKKILVADTEANEVSILKITVMKLYVPVLTLSTQENIKLLKQLAFTFKRTINWNKYHSKKSSKAQKIFKCFNWSKK